MATGQIIVDEKFEETPVSEVIDVLENKYDVRLVFSQKLIQDLTISADIRKESLEKALQLIFQDSQVDFELLDGRTVILKQKQKESLTYAISGIIRDAESGERLPYAHVYTADLSKSTTTNEHGAFTLSGLKDTVQVKASFMGYSPTSFTTIPTLANSRQTLGLSKNAELLEEVEVTNDVAQLMEVESVGQVNLDPALAFSVPSSAEKDPIRMMHLLPGVNSTNELSAGLEIQGGNSTQNVINFDGFRIYHMDHFFGYFSAINPYSLKSQRLMKSGYSARYGGGSSGYLQMIGKDGNKEKVSGRLSINQLSLNSSLEVPISDKTTLFASARRSYADFVESSLFERIFDEYRDQLYDEGEYNLPIADFSYEPDFQFNDMNFKVSSNVSAKSQLSFSIYSSADKLNFDEFVRIRYPRDSAVLHNQMGFVNWGNLGTSGKLTRYWNKSHFSEFFLSYSKYGSEFEEISTETYMKNRMPVGSSFDEDYQENSIEDVSFDFEHEWRLQNTLIETGFQATVFNTKIQSLYNDSTIIDKRQKQVFLITHFANGSFDLGPKSTLGIGVRTNYIETKSGLFLEPRISFTHELDGATRFSLASGIHRQFINQVITKNTLQGSRDLWVVSDDEVPDQRAFHASVNITKSLGRSFLEAGFFCKEFSGLLDYAFAQGARLTEFTNYEELFFEGQGYSRGLELMYKLSTPRFDALAGYTFKLVEYRFDDINQGDWYPADHDQRHEVNALAIYRFGKFSFASTWYFGSGTPYTEFEPRRPVDTGDGGGQSPPEVVFLLPTEEKNSSRFAPYNRIDLNLEYKREIGNVEMTLGANLFNVLNQTNSYDRQISFTPVQDAPPAISFNTLSLMGRTLSFSAEVAF